MLQTKLYLPALRPDWVPRPRLLAKLAIQPQTRLILVSAPAGYGKTTLVTAWLRQLAAAGEAQVCWLALDEEDSDPQQFFRYLAAAVQPLPGVQSALPHLLQANQTIAAKTMLKAFVQDVTAISVPFLLVLDDYHALDSAEIEEGLAALLERMPPQMTLILTSRSDPGFPISRLRARGQLIELRASDLRFTEAEAAHFLQQTMGLSLSPEQIAALESRTEGWVAGLQMAALSLQHRAGDELATFVANFTGSHRFIMDYLTDEVLAQVSAEVQAFLLHTAVLHRVCADLAEAVLPAAQRGRAPEMLAHLEATNIFLIPLDDERCWYRYHHLFANLLQQKLPADSAKTIRRKAADWSIDHGLVRDAIEYALAAEAWETAIPLLSEHGLAFLFRGKLATLRRWFDTIPAELVKQHPRMCLNYAWVLVNQGHAEKVERYLQAAEQAAHGAPAIRAVTGIIRANQARASEDWPVVQAEATLALELAAPDNGLTRGTALLQLGAQQMLAEEPELETAIVTLAESVKLAEQSGNMNTRLLTGGYLGWAHLLRADEPAAKAALQNTKTFAADHGLEQSPLLVYVHLGLAHLAFLAGNLAGARNEIEQAQADARFAYERSGLCRSEMLLVVIEQSAGNHAAAEVALAQATETALALKNPNLRQRIQFLREFLTQTDPPPALVKTAGLLAAGASWVDAQAVVHPGTAPPALIDPLSERELEILALVAAGLKNKEIADQLVISLNTVLYHTKNIYGKLGVNKRALAIAKARELDLL
ncbi:MAG: AAA family ATPase [Anaerolineae bacterium]|nr:AAA family ATPase [Anaerolineae bacterium]